MLEIEKKLQESAVEYFMFKSSTTQQIKNLVDFSESLQLNLDNLKSCSDGIQQRLVAKDIEISSLHASLNSNKNVMMGYFENTKEDLTKTYNEIMEASRESQKIADDALRKSTTVTLRQKEIEGSIEKNLVLIKDVLCQISKVSQEKASIVDLRTEAKTLQKGIDQINERSGQIEVSVLELIRYLDTYIPVDIQVAVSDNLYSYLDARPLKKF